MGIACIIPEWSSQEEAEVVTSKSNSDQDRHVETRSLDAVSIRFCGDSGDGMQITGGQFTNTTAVFGNDFATFPDFPAEIRAPRGTTFGVSGFQVQFSKEETTPREIAWTPWWP